MKFKLSLFLLLIINLHFTVQAAPGRGVLAGEYFWDTDPGKGNATTISTSSTAFGSEVTFIIQNNIGLPSPVGIHTFNIRIKDAAGNWGPLFTTAFDLESATSTTRYVKTGEYFWDTDPGLGNGLPMVALSGSFTTAYQLLGQSNITLPALGAHTFNMRTQDAAGNWGPVFTVVVSVETPLSSLREDSVTAAEYFWDTDPGQGSGNPMLISRGGSLTAAVQGISKSGIALPSGVGAHTLNIRSKDVAGNWGTVFTVVVDVQTPVSSLREDSLESAEYFWDTDPGQGSGNPMLLSRSGSLTAAVQGISKSGVALPSGVGAHTLNIRSKDVAGNWGNVFTVVVDVETPVSSLREDSLESAEYFWDTDPGQGSGNPMLLSRGGSLTAALEGISKSGMALPSAVGAHTLNIRSKDVAGNWGPVFTVVVDVQTPVSSLREDSVEAAEYFWDTDPGQGGGNPMLLTRGGSLTAAVQGISQSGVALPTGIGAHTLNIRSKDVAGNWGPVFTVVTDVQAPVSSLRKDSVIAGEYFFDTDPGLGNGTPLILAKGAPTTRTGDIRSLVGGNLPAVTQGLHVLYFRAKDIAGNWGPSFGIVDSIGVTNCYNLAFTGNSTICSDRLGGNTYSVPLYNSNTYTWTVTGGTIASVADTNSIVVNWNASGPYKLSVTECASGGTSCCSDSMVPVLLTAATSSVSVSICQGQSYGGHSTNGTFTDTLNGAAANGCDSIRTLHLTVTSPPTATVSGATPVCVGANVILSVFASGDTGTITYQWQSSTTGTSSWTNVGTNSTTYAPVTSSAGTLYYQCVITYSSPGCNTATSNIVSELVSQQPSATISGGNISVCDGASVNFTATPSGGAGTATYQWQSSPNGTSGWANVGSNANTYSPVTSSIGTTYYQVIVSYSGAGCTNATSNNQDIIVGPQPTASISGGNDTVCKGGSSVLTATTTGTGTASYQWQSSPNGTNWTPVGSNTGNYSPATSSAGVSYYEVVISYSGVGCNNATSNSETVTVVTPPSVVINGGNDTVCANSSNNLTALVSGGAGTPAYQWQSSANGTTGWSNVGSNSTSYTPSTLTTGTLYYRVVVTFAGSGCSSDTSNVQYIAIVQPTVSITGGNTTICTGGNVTFTAKLMGETGSVTYQWQSSPNGISNWTNVGSNSNTYIPVTSPAGTTYYQVVVSYSGSTCNSATSNVEDIIVDAQPTASISGGNDTVCSGGSSALTATATGAGTASYQWQSSLNGTTWTPVGTNADTYSPLTSSVGVTYYQVVVSYTGAGCNNATSTSETVTVLAPPIVTVTGGDDTVCANSTNILTAITTGGAAVLTYQWQNSANGALAWNNVGTNASTYASSTSSVGTLYYRVVAIFQRSGCSSDTSNVQAVTVNGHSDTSSFSITRCEGTPYFFKGMNIYQTGTYPDTLTAVSGCDSIVTLYLSVLPASTTSVSDTICRGTSYNFFGKTITSSGNYSDTLLGSAGCDSIIALAMYVPTQPSITVTGADTLSTGIYLSYQWLLNDTIIQGATSRQYIAVRNGTYKVMVMATKNCEDTSEPVVVKTVGINTIANDERISLYPNPTTGELKINIEGLTSGPIVIRLFDLYGQRVFADLYAVSSGSYSTMMHLDQLPAGVYYISILSGQNTYGRKVEVVR